MIYNAVMPSWQTCLPLELYSHIIKFVARPGDLFRICLVSQYFLHEGSRWLYHDNKFTNIRTLSKFIHAILNHPHLSSLVHGLTLHFPEYFEGLHSKSGTNLIKAMLGTLKNLKRLVIAGLSPSTLALLLHGCPFTLQAFKTNTLLTQEMVDALTRQHHISEWTYQIIRPDVLMPITFSNGFLPKLTVLSIPAHLLTQIPAQQWAIARLNLDLSGYGGERESRLGDVLKHFGSTLISLSLGRLSRRCGQRKMPMIPMIARFAKDIPRLRFLGVSDDSAPSTKDVLSLPSSSWTALRDLQTFVWWVDDGSAFDRMWGFSILSDSASCPPSSSTFATYTALSCVSLRRFIYVSKDDSAGFIWSNGVRKEVPWKTEVDDYTAPGAWTWA